MRRTETKDEGTNRGRRHHKLRAKAPQAERKGTRAENRASDERGAECGEKTRGGMVEQPGHALCMRLLEHLGARLGCGHLHQACA